MSRVEKLESGSEQKSPRAVVETPATAEKWASVGSDNSKANRSFELRDWLFAATLFIAVFLVYQPTWHGGLLWDDDAHVTKPELRSWQGLYRIWFDVGATMQYYPLLHSSFWVEHTLWGDAPLGYHLVKIFLHCVAALMVAILLRRLAVPGAYLAAAIFALHPVQVESVAWISEQKNALSAVLYLGAAMAYLRFDRTRRMTSYWVALGLFVLALLSKTVTATLPGALLVIFWWQRGRLSWQKDVLPLLPFFVVGAGLGMITAWWELKFNQCFGPEFEFTGLQRILIAGRAVWFHLWKLFWPANLTFIYPRWQVDPRAGWQYLYPLGAVALVAVAWAMRSRMRAPLAALLYFGGTLFPVMGFFNLYTFRYSLVADHYQYLACLGIMTLFSASAAFVLRRVGGSARVIGYVGCVALVALLAVLSWRQSRMYADVETLYRTTLEQNPDCWLAYTNLGNIVSSRGHTDEAIALHRMALEINPNSAEVQTNLGTALARRGQMDEAIMHFQRALEIKPNSAGPHTNLGLALARRGHIDEAMAHFRTAVEIDPRDAEAHANLGLALAGRRQLDEAILHYRWALSIRPNYLEVHYNLGLALTARGEIDKAISHFRIALEIKPDFAEAHYHLGIDLSHIGRIEEAIVHYQKALQIKPEYAAVHTKLGLALAARDRVDEAIAQYKKGLEGKPDDLEAQYNLGLALDRRGRFDEAVEHFRKALALALARHDKALADTIRTLIRLHQPDLPGGKVP